MINKFINSILENRNLKSIIKFDFYESYDFVLEHSTNINLLQPVNISVPISADIGDNLIIIAQQDGFLKILRNTDLSFVHSVKAHDGIINDLKLRPKYSNHLLTGSTDCNLILHDIETKQKLTTFFDSDHKSAIRTLDFYDSSLIATSTRNGKIQLWDIRESALRNKPVQSIDNAHLNEEKLPEFCKVVTSLVFSYLKYLYSCSPKDNQIKIWDLRFNNSLVYFNKLKYSGSSNKVEGFRCLSLGPLGDLYASCTDNKIYQYSYQNLISNNSISSNLNCSNSDFNNNKTSNIKCFGGVSLTGYTKIKVLKDLNLLVSGSSDAEVMIWSLDKTMKDFINYPTIILPHLLEEVSIILLDSSRYEIITCDDANNVYKWILNSKLNNKFIRKYRKGRISETYNRKENKPFNANHDRTRDRKRFLSGNNNDLLSQDEIAKRPFKRSRSVIERVI